MTTKHEAAAQALHAVLVAALPIPIELDDERADDVPPAGLAALLSGDTQELDRRLGVDGKIEWQQDAELVLIASAAARRAVIEGLLAQAGAALAADRTLGGAVDWVEIGAPEPSPESALPGAASARGVRVTMSLFYETGPNPLEDQA